MAENTIEKKILSEIKTRKEPMTQSEIAKKISKINRAVLLGYLRCMADLGIIKSKNIGKAKSYYS